MMDEVCYCGRSGGVEDRLPIYVGDGQRALQCPACGDIDDLHWVPMAARGALLEEAERRQAMRRVPERVACTAGMAAVEHELAAAGERSG